MTHQPEALDVVFVADRQVSCVGSGPALGHPKVFYTISDKGYVECMYCDRVFVYDPARAGERLGD
ncbi:MAG: zinc-finger domain-containing protein [Pseudomonadota bacterium]